MIAWFNKIIAFINNISLLVSLHLKYEMFWSVILALPHFDGFCKITNGLDIMESDTEMLYHQHK